MKIKIEFKTKSIFLYAYILLLIINIGLISYLAFFFKNNVYDTIYTDPYFLENASQTNVGDVNTKKFESIVEKNNKKIKKNQIIISNNTNFQ